MKIFGPNFFRPKSFWTQNFWTTFFWDPKFSSFQRIFRPTIFLDPTTFWNQIYGPRTHIFLLKYYLDQKKFESFLDETFFLRHNFVDTTFFKFRYPSDQTCNCSLTVSAWTDCLHCDESDSYPNSN